MMKALWLAPLLLVAGCAAVGPDYQRPDVALPTAFVGGNSAEVRGLATRAWWEDYRDPILNDLVRRGLAQNLDVKEAEEAVRQAEANLRATGINAALSGSGTAERVRAGGDQMAAGYYTNTSLSADVVLDLFGGIRRGQQAAEADLAASRAEVEVTRLFWLAELIAAYGNARYNQEALAITRETVRAREETVSITRNKFNAGDATELDTAEAEALLETARADLPAYRAQFDANVFAIATLLNEPAAPILAVMERGAAPLRTPGSVATGVPADLLRNRPDVRMDEADLRAAVAEVGVAEADMLPSITLGGTVGRTTGTESWSFGPSLTLPILNQGALAADRDAAISAARQAEITWRAAIVSAVEDVQTGQSTLRQYRAHATALDRAAASYARAYGLAQGNFRDGAIDLLDLLDTDRNKTAAEISAASAANQAAQEWATLQIATGAGAAVGGGAP